MIDARVIDEISKNVEQYLPDSLKTVKGDVEKNVRSALQGSFEKLDLVTREDYEIQLAIVAKLRARLDALEQRVDALEGGSGTAE